MPLSEYFIQRLSSAVGTGSLEKKANLAKKALELLSSMPKSSIKKLMEAEVAKITGLSKKDIEESSGSRSVSKKIGKTSFSKEDLRKKESFFESEGLIIKTLAALIAYPELVKELESEDWINELTSPESILFKKVAHYFQNTPNGNLADLLSSLAVSYTHLTLPTKA